MATLAEITYDIREAIKEYTDDSEIDDRYIHYLINIKRAKYLKQRLDQLGRKFNTRILQTFCLGTEEVSINECGLDLECDTILRTNKTLPQFLQLSDKDAIERISPSNRLSKKFNVIPREKASYLNSSYHPNKIKTYLHNDGYLYFIGGDDIFLECVSITGVFENPLDLQEYKNCCNCEDSTQCIDIDTIEYPIQIELIDIIREDIIKDLLRTKQIPEDKLNNSND